MDAAPDSAYCNPDVLMRMVHGGSPDALDRITKCYGQRLLTAANQYCRTRTEAEDAVQDAYLIAATRLDDFRGGGQLGGLAGAYCRQRLPSDVTRAEE